MGIAAAAESDRNREPIAVLGMGCRLPGGIECPEQLWQLLAEGREAITDLPEGRWDQALHHHPDPRHPLTQHVSRGGFVSGIDQFDPGLFGISPREAVCMDPQQRLLLEVAWRALEDGAQPLERLKGRSVGVFVGISSGDYGALLWASEQRWLTPDNDPFILAGNTGCIAANRISYCFDWRGPSFTIDTACSSSLVAVDQACASLWRGEAELALAGGVQALIHPGLQMTFCKAGLLSPHGRCRSFDANADGYVRSEGAGAVLLKPLAAALRDGDPIQAVIRGTAVNSDGRSPGMASPSQRAQADCIRRAYAQTGLDPRACLYVEAHGTGTRQGDPIELRALGAVLGAERSPEWPCRVGSVKSNLGHSETAAGITGLIKAVLCLRHRQLPASLHVNTPNPGVEWPALGLQVQTELEPFPPSAHEPVLSVSSFGFGGTNAHAVLTPAPEPVNDAAGSAPGPWLLLLSARSAAALDQLRAETLTWLERHPDLDLVDVSATSLRGRSRFPHALACSFLQRHELLAQLRAEQPLSWQGTLDGDGPVDLQALISAVTLPARHRWLPLPGHPFLRQPYWWPQARAGEPMQGASLWLDQLGLSGQEPPQALAWQRLDLPGANSHLQARIALSAQDDLADHRIRGRIVVPAAAHLAMALDWQQRCGASLQVEALELEAPLRLEEQGDVRLQGVLENDRLELFSRDSQDGADWRRHGALRLASASSSVSTSEPAALFAGGLDANAAMEPLDCEGFYAGLRGRGLEYGPSYQPIRRLQRRNGEAVAWLERPPEGPDRCLLDGCLQVVAAALPEEDARAQLLLPVGVERLKVLRWPLPDRLICWAQRRTAVAGDDPAVVLADLWLEVDGERLGWIEGLRLRRLPRPMLDLLFPPPAAKRGPEQLETVWHPASPPAETLEVELSDPSALIELEGIALAGVLDRVRDRSAQDPLQLRVIVRDAGPEALGLRAALRCIALERPRWSCSWWWLPPLDQRQPDAAERAELVRCSQGCSELRWHDGQILEPRLQHLPPERQQWLSDGRGRLDGVHCQPLPAPELMPGELELQVEATGLNFRDVLNALGLLRAHAESLGLEGAGPLPFGGEAVGRVLAVGEGVDPALVGQRMLAALTPGSLASHVLARADLCVPWPEALPLELGASVSTAFLTAMHGLVALAQLQPGETVLIHAAAGGVGMAALQVAQRCGARIVATASAGKQEAVRAQPGVEAVWDSRSTAFAEQVLRHTDGRGVDVVLNSLKGEWVDASFAALAEGGRFVELGKLEVWSAELAQERRPDAHYHRFDLLELAAADPLPLRRQLLEICSAFEQGSLAPIPWQAFPVERLDEAFRLMAQGRHVGKLVILQPPRPRPVRIVAAATYLVTGALGGVGLQLLQWLVAQGARSLVLVGRSADAPSDAALAVIEQLESQGVRCQRLACDLAGGAGEADRLSQALAALPSAQPLRGVIHGAGVLRDRPLVELDSDDIEAVAAPKVAGWQLLDEVLSAQPAMEFCVAFSSVAALLGSPGQIAYAAANGAMEAVCGQAPGPSPLRLAIQWGPWAGVGMASGLAERFNSVGLGMLAPEEAFAALGALLERGRSGVVAVLEADWARLAGQASPRQAALFQDVRPEPGADARLVLEERLRSMAGDQRQPWLLQALRQRLAQVMESEPGAIDPAASLFSLGLDSLMGVEFAAVVQSDLGVHLDFAALQNDPTLEDLARIALVQVLPDAGAVGSGLDLGSEAQLPPDWAIAEHRCSVAAPGQRLLLTGATGFLGAYLLVGQLRRWPELRLRCLVRCRSQQQGLERLEANLRRYGLWQVAWAERLEVVPADLALPRFGLEEAAFRALVDGVGGILHNGAQLSQMASYAQLAAANVGSTRELLHLAALDRPIRLELISSVAVFEADAYRNREISEAEALPHWQGIHLGYSQTKWVSDQLVWAAGQAGLPVTVYRPPLIGGSSRPSADGCLHWHEGDLLQRLLEGCLQLGCFPDLEWELDAVPVDYVADAVTALAWSPEATGKAFHLQHPQPLLLSELLGRLSARGGGLKAVSMKAWLEAIASRGDHPLQPLQPFLEQRWGSEGLTYPERNARGVRARPSCDATIRLLESRGISCPPYRQLETVWGAALMDLSM